MSGRRISMPVRYWRWIRLPADRAADRSFAEIRRAVERVHRQARARMAARPELRETPENFLEGMLAAQESDNAFTDDEIIGNTFTLLLAGEDTTAHTMAWTIWLLASRARGSGALRRGGGRGPRRAAASPTRLRRSRRLQLRRGGAARVHAPEAGRSDPRRRAPRRYHDRGNAHTGRDARDAAHALREHARRRLCTRGRLRSRAVAEGRRGGTPRSTIPRRSSRSAPARASVPGATSRFWSQRARWR